MKKILITGGLGFLGSNLAEMCLSEGHEVKIISKSDSKIGNISKFKDKVKVQIKDLQSISGSDVEGLDWIFHFAGTTHNYHIQDNPYIDIQTNCIGTISLLEACRAANPSVRMVYGSTFFVNGNLANLPANTESPCEPLGLYPATRLAGEHFCKIYNRTFDMNTNIVRFTNLFGVREQRDNKQKAGFNFLINLALEGKEIPLYRNGEFYRDYLYVSDAASAAMTVADRGEKGKVYYVGTGRKEKFKDLITILGEEVGGIRVDPINPPEFHNAVGIKDFFCDVTPLRGLGWEPKISIREGIRRTLEEYRVEKK